MRAKKTTFYYGWVVVAAASLMEAVLSAGTFCFSLFVKPMSEAFGWSRADITLAIAVLFVGGPLLFIITGRMCDRHGPRILNLIGGISLAIGFYLCSRVSNLWLFYLGYGIFGGIGLACIYVPLAATLSKWFVRHRGIVLGIFYAGGGLGGLILSPILQQVINNYGWRSAWLVMATLAGSLTLPVTLLLRKDPEEIGLLPLGQGEESDAALSGRSDTDANASVRSYSFKEAIASQQLWIYNAGVLLLMGSIIGVQHNMVPYVTDRGIAKSIAAMALGFASGVNAFGRMAMGFLSDKIGTRRSLFIVVFGAAVALFYILLVDRNWMLMCFAILFGFVFGGFVPLNVRVIADLFGTENIGAIMGISGIFAALGPAFGPVCMAAVFDKTGSYVPAFISAGGAVIVAFLLFALLDLPRKRRKMPA